MGDSQKRGKSGRSSRRGAQQSSRKPNRSSQRRGAKSGSDGRSSRRGAGQERRRADRTGGAKQATSAGKPAKPTKLPAGAEGLPRHVVESLMRVTPANRQNAALAALGAAAEAFSEGQFHAAVKKAEHAKDLASRDATIREILGLASYRIGDWETALRELRTYRRLSGETTHMPVEMDVLRALRRDTDVESAWQEFNKRGGGPAAKKEARVVYASFLIDRGDLEGAWKVAGTPKSTDNPWPEDLRLWYVAARIAALRGEIDQARRLAGSILLEDPSFPGLDELDRLIASR